MEFNCLVVLPAGQIAVHLCNERAAAAWLEVIVVGILWRVTIDNDGRTAFELSHNAAQAPGMLALLGIAVLVVALEVGRARIDHHQYDAAPPLNVTTDSRLHFRYLEDAGDEIDGDRIGVELHLR